MFAEAEASAAATIGIVAGLICLGFVIHFLPTFIAVVRKHHNTTAIAVFNLLLGWTFVGWAIALVWSFTAVDDRLRR